LSQLVVGSPPTVIDLTADDDESDDFFGGDTTHMDIDLTTDLEDKL
jgi:hypothetical protein